MLQLVKGDKRKQKKKWKKHFHPVQNLNVSTIRKVKVKLCTYYNNNNNNDVDDGIKYNDHDFIDSTRTKIRYLTPNISDHFVQSIL